MLKIQKTRITKRIVNTDTLHCFQGSLCIVVEKQSIRQRAAIKSQRDGLMSQEIVISQSNARSGHLAGRQMSRPWLLIWLRQLFDVPRMNQITTDQMQTVMTATGMAMTGHMFNTLIASVALSSSQDNPLWIWWSLSSLLLAYYVYRRRIGRRRPKKKTISSRSLRRTMVFAILLALPWGILPVAFLDPSDGPTMLVFIALVTGMSASGGVLLAPVYPAAFCYVATILLPTFVVFLSLEPTAAHLLLACLAMSYGGFLFATMSIVARISIGESQSKKELQTIVENVRSVTARMNELLDYNTRQQLSSCKTDGSLSILDILQRSIDKLEQQDAQLKDSEAKVSSLIDSAMDAIVAIDRAGRIQRFNPAAAVMFDWNPVKQKKLNLKNNLSPEGWAAVSAKLEELADSTALFDPDHLIETSGLSEKGRKFPVEVSVTCPGEDQLITLIFRDVSQRKNSEAKLLLLMKEVNHRSRNLMAVLSSIRAMTAASANNLEEFNSKFSTRMQSLLKSQEIITADEWGRSDLRALLKVQIDIYGSDSMKRIHLTGPEIQLGPKAVQNIGLAVHELATNSAKYGALSVPEGEVKVGWRQVNVGKEEKLFIFWRDMNGPKVVVPEHSGFGSVLLKSLVGRDLDGHSAVKYRQAGLSWQAFISSNHFFSTDEA